MTRTTVVPATRELITQLLKSPLRQQDVNEHVLLSGQRVEDSLAEVDLQYTRICLDPKGKPIAVWGLGGGYAWLLATVEAEQYALSIQRHWKKELAFMALWLGPGAPLWAINLVATTNRRWHEALGFVVHYEDALTVLYRRDFSWVR